MRTVWIEVVPYLPKAEAATRWAQWLKEHSLGEGDFRDTDVTRNRSKSPNPNVPSQYQYAVKRRALVRLNLPAERDSYISRPERVIRPDDEQE
jgi:CHAD domain-containing protein